MLIAGIPGAVITKKTRLGLDLKGGVELVYQGQAHPAAAEGRPRPRSTARSRSCASASTSSASPSPRSSARAATRSRSACPDVKNAQRAIKQVGTVAQLFFYDWEANVLGPDGKPNPSEPNGHRRAERRPGGRWALYDAVMRAAKRPPINDNNTTADQYYLVNDKHKKVLRGPGGHRQPTSLGAPQAGASRRAAKVVKVNEGTIVVAGREGPASKGAPPATSSSTTTRRCRAPTSRTPSRTSTTAPAATAAPIVTFEFTDKGRKKWQNVTRKTSPSAGSSQPPAQAARAGPSSTSPPCSTTS